MKRVLSVQDLSCVGKCSLGAALPVLSVMGVEACALPTAVLSSHTAFLNITRADLTDRIPAVMDAWGAEGITFDAILSGYLGAKEQMALVKRLWTQCGKKKSLRICDPAMGDGGELYRGFDSSYVTAMWELVRDADVILPNVTEVCLLLGKPWRDNFTEKEQKDLVLSLAENIHGSIIMLGKPKVLIPNLNIQDLVFRQQVLRLPTQCLLIQCVGNRLENGKSTVGRKILQGIHLAEYRPTLNQSLIIRVFLASSDHQSNQK